MPNPEPIGAASGITATQPMNRGLSGRAADHLRGAIPIRCLQALVDVTLFCCNPRFFSPIRLYRALNAHAARLLPEGMPWLGAPHDS
jgi:hypothetical protein